MCLFGHNIRHGFFVHGHAVVTRRARATPDISTPASQPDKRNNHTPAQEA